VPVERPVSPAMAWRVAATTRGVDVTGRGGRAGGAVVDHAPQAIAFIPGAQSLEGA
jgi:hypothetical protein